MYKVYMDSMLLPIAPSKISKRIRGLNASKTLIDNGEINVLSGRGLLEISFEAMLPSKKYSFAVYENNVFLSPEVFIRFFTSLMDLKTPFYFKVLRTFPNDEKYFDDNLLVSLENFTVSEDFENGTDLSVSIELKEFKTFATEIISVSESGTVSSEKERLSLNKTTAKTYTVKKGDNLWTICQRELGSGSKYKEIASLNNISNPRLIYPGQVISLE